MGTSRPHPAVSWGLESAQTSLGSSSRPPACPACLGTLRTGSLSPLPARWNMALQCLTHGTSWHQPYSLAGAPLLAPSSSPQEVSSGAARASSPLCQAGRLQHWPERPPGTQTLLWAQAKPLHCTTQHPPCSLCLHSLAVVLPTFQYASVTPEAAGTPTWFH